MRTDFGLHIPGVKGLFDSCEEIESRTRLPRDDDKRIPGGIPEVVEIRHKRTGQHLGRIPWIDALIKFR